MFWLHWLFASERIWLTMSLQPPFSSSVPVKIPCRFDSHSAPPYSEYSTLLRIVRLLRLIFFKLIQNTSKNCFWNLFQSLQLIGVELRNRSVVALALACHSRELSTLWNTHARSCWIVELSRIFTFSTELYLEAKLLFSFSVWTDDFQCFSK